MTKTGLDVFSAPAEVINFNTEEAKKVLEAKLDERWIKQRTVGKATLSYIGGQTVIRLLNKAFNYQWSFEVVTEAVVQSMPKHNKWAKNGQPEWEDQPPVAKVLGRLTVPGLGVKEQYGSKILIGGASEQESAFKSAGTDALKKCASLFGIGLELYGEDEGMDTFAAAEEADSTPAPPSEQKKPAKTKPKAESVTEAPAPETPVEPEPEKPAKQAANGQSTATAATGQWRKEDVERLKDLKGILGVTNNEELDVYVKKFFDNEEVSFRNITPENIKAVNIFLAQEAESL